MATQDSLFSYQKLLILSIPATLSVMVEPLAAVIDTALVGRLNSEWLASMALASTTFSTLTWIFNFLIFGVSARIASLVGKNDTKGIGGEIQMAILIALASGGIATVFLFVFDEFILSQLLGADPDLIRTTLPYFHVRAWSFPLVLFVSVNIGILRGAKNLKKSFYLISAMTLSNALLTYYFLYILETSFVGAAWGTLLSYAVGCFLALIFLYLSRRPLGLMKLHKIEPSRFFTFGNASLNIFLRTASLTGSFFLMTAVATRFGTSVLGAHQVLMQFWIIPPFVVDGLAIVATSYGGEALGRKDKRTFQLIGNRLLIISVFLGCAFTAIYGFASEPLIALFTRSQGIIELVQEVWWLLVLLQIPNALVFVYDGILFGAQKFSFLRKRMVEGFLLLFLPLIALSYFEIESLTAVWLALSGLYLYRLLSSAYLFHRSFSQFST